MEHDYQSTQVGTPNDYTYNGKELNDDFQLNLHDYGARWYDASIGRWHSVDPLAEKYSMMSPYNYVANNPVNFIDMRGDSITGDETGMKNLNSIISYAQGIIKMEDAQVMKDFGVDASQVSAIRGYYQTALDEINAVKESTSVMVYIRTMTSEEIHKESEGTGIAMIRYDVKNGRLEVGVADGWPVRALLAHELKHAYQFLMGKHSFLQRNEEDTYANGGLLYDRMDEVEAAKTEGLFYDKSFAVQSQNRNLEWLDNNRGVYKYQYGLPANPINLDSKDEGDERTYLQRMEVANTYKGGVRHIYNNPNK